MSRVHTLQRAAILVVGIVLSVTVNAGQESEATASSPNPVIANGDHATVKMEFFTPSKTPKSVESSTKMASKASQSQGKSAPSKKDNQYDKSDGHNVTLNFQQIKTKVLLQLLAKTSGLNFIISESVKGSMTLHLNNVPWKQALKIILKANGLDMRRFDNVILIAPIQELADNEINELLARQKVKQLAPLQSKILTLNYANAEEIAAILKGSSNTILSARGQVGVDTRTNSLWLRDLAKNLDEIEYYVRKLDVPAKQVLIEAKIVKIASGFTRDLGVRFGVSRPGRLAGTLLKADGKPGEPTNSFEAVKDRLNFNIPSGLEGAGSIALSLVKIGSKNFLDLELSALEEEDHAETIASPRLITSNQKEAIIEQGEEIPYLAASSSGATSIEFKKAVLSLKITPQITPDRNITLRLKVTQDTRGKEIVLTSDDDSLSSQLLPPAINTEQIESHVFLRNGQTIVIGGIFMREKSDVVRRIPFFGNIPVLGALFRNKVHENGQTELLVFITPRIIDRGYLGPKYSHRYCGERKYKAI